MTRNPLRAALALCLAVTMLAAAAPPVQRALLTLRVNTIAKQEITVELQGASALVRRADLDAAGLHGFPYERTAKASDWVSLDSLAPALTYRVDDTNLELDLTVTGDHLAMEPLLTCSAASGWPLRRPRAALFLIMRWAAQAARVCCLPAKRVRASAPACLMGRGTLQRVKPPAAKCCDGP